MAIQDGTMMLQKDSDQNSKKSGTITDHTAYIMERTDRTVEKLLDEMIAKQRAKRVESMSEQMSLEDYKKKVEECLIRRHNYTAQGANKLMTDYEDDFQEALNDFSWTPETMAGAMIAGY